MKILISTENVHRDEIQSLKESIENDCWHSEELSKSEITGIIQMINYLISKRKNESATDLSYMDLLNLKNKLQKP